AIIIVLIFTLSLYFLDVSILLEPLNTDLNEIAFQSNESNEDSSIVSNGQLKLTKTIDTEDDITLNQVNSTQIDDTKVNHDKINDEQVDNNKVNDTQPDTQILTQFNDTKTDDIQIKDTQIKDTQIKDTQIIESQVNNTQIIDSQVNDTQVNNDNTKFNDIDMQINKTQSNNMQVNNTQVNAAFTQDDDDTRLNAVIIVLVRNSELHPLRKTMRSFEDRWNKKYNYPYVFLNDQEFTQEFKDMTGALTNAKTYYGLIPKHMWGYPSWIDQARAAETRRDMGSRNILYGDSESYRHMCRFNSGFFFRHELIENFDYYWRLEPGVDFTCDIDYDTFKYIKENNITYGFTIALLEMTETIPTLWRTVLDFLFKYPQHIADNNFAYFISRDDMANYNGNFEIGDLNFYRSEQYLQFFDFLDQAGGFYYERWGDAPIHSIALLLFLERSQIHFFNDIGYSHPPFQHCPVNKDFHNSGKCYCDPASNFDLEWGSCTKDWLMI
ncbi:9972_t:CDS:2, partial [Scutellospora calospora]